MTIADNLLDALVAARSDGPRRGLVHENSTLKQPEAVQRLCSRAHGLASENPRLAQESADAAVWLARTIQHPRSLGLAHRTLGNVYSYLGKLREALIEYKQALAVFTNLSDTHQVAITRSSALPTVTDLLGADTALEWADLARSTFAETADQLRLARLENNLAVIFFRKEDFYRALLHWKKAYRTLKSIGETSDEATALRNLAVCSISLNQPAEANSYYRKARRLCIENNFTYLLHLIDYNIAYLHYLQGNHHEALKLYREARSRSRQLADTYHEALCSLDETEIYIELNLLQEADTVAQLALTQFQDQHRPYEAAKSLYNLALIRLRQGRHREALSSLDDAATAFSGLGNILWPGEVELLRAQIFYSEGRFYESNRAAEQALQMFRSSNLRRRVSLAKLLLAKSSHSLGALAGAENLCKEAVASFDEHGEPDSLFQAFFILGQVLDARGEAESALTSFQRAESYLLELRERRAVARIKVPIVGSPLDVYSYLVELLLEAQDISVLSPGLFRLVAIAKARSFVDLMAPSDRPARATTKMRSQLVDQVSSLRQELNWLYRRIDRSELQQEAPSEAVLRDLQRQSRTKERDLAHALFQLRTRNPEIGTDPERVGVAEVEAVQESLGDAVLVEYFVAHDVVIAMVVSRGDAVVLPVTVRSTVLELQRRLWYYFHHSPVHKQSSDYVTGSASPILEQLYSELISPLEHHLTTESVIIAPHDFLFSVPFHALRSQGNYFSDSFSVSYVPHAGVLPRLSPFGPVRLRDFLLLSGLDGDTVASVLPHEAAGGTDSRCLRSASLADLADLRPHQGWSAVHLRAEASLRADNPLFSVLSVGDSQLPILDLYRLKLLGPILTVEGEGLAASNPEGHAEVSALWGAFLTAGARSALVPTGLSDPAVQRKHARLLYENLLRGLDSASAHRLAMARMRRDGAPLYEWAGMFLVGDPHLRLEVSTASNEGAS